MPTATKIMIIRHAEKPPKKGGPPLGVSVDGANGANMLIVQGWQRAGALATLFAPSRGPLQSALLATPGTLFACTPDTSSQRPCDTLAPLSAKLGVAIDQSFGEGDTTPMIARAMACQGTVLICWEHKHIQRITAQIPRRDAQPPDTYLWPGSRFDVVFVFDLDGDAYRFSQVPELLLAGDIATPIDLRAGAPAADDDA